MAYYLYLAGVLLLAIAPDLIYGQVAPELTLGARVRLSATDGVVLGDSPPASTMQPVRGFTGRLHAISADSLVVERDRAGAVERIRVSWSSLERLEVSCGKSRGRGARRGALIGGLAYGAFLGFSLWNEYRGEPQVLPQGFAVGAVVGGVIGAGVGALIRLEAWQQVPLRNGSRAEAQ